ncbi:SAC3/GANP/Nin1/mts3/eIF-3 p25 family-domain-containing protein [Cerioporus squamosus]|nr:SAC3/GANP/Nin1/mts3/eIF-3 p25 family-domain-containing protein [Cerioporus squamosus]
MMHIHGAASDKPRRPLQSKNKKWTAGQGDSNSGHVSDGERWERGGHRRRGWGRGGHGHHGTHLTVPADVHDEMTSATEDEGASGDSAHEDDGDQPREPETAEEREKFFQELVKQRDIEKKKAIAEGKMDDPLVPKRLDEAITMVGTCMDMCPRFERYRRERENNLDRWEVIPGTKRVDHKRAVKIYERAAGDKTLPSDLRPPPVLKRTLDYLFHELLVKEGFSQTYSFIRDRSRAVRNDFTMQHETGPLAIECHDRCARFHILALHLERDTRGFSVALEEQQLMNTLQSLKEFYEDQRGRYQAPTELEMRVYHRLIHIRDQRERHEEIPDEIRNHPVFRLTTQFRLTVQAKSAPISKTSALVVDDEGMQIFSQLAAVLREQNNVVMIYLVACIMERHFGKECIEDIESIRGDLSIPEIIDGISKPLSDALPSADGETSMESPESLAAEITEIDEESTPAAPPVLAPQSVPRSATEWLNNNFGAPPAANRSAQTAFQPSPFTTSPPSTKFAFSNLGSGTAFPSSASAPSAFGNLATAKSAFGGATFGPPPTSSSAPSFFGNGATTNGAFGSSSSSAFGPSTGGSSPFAPATPQIARAPLTSQPTWPAESSAQPTTTQLPEVSPPKTAGLNPFASTFVPPSSAVAPSAASSSQAPPPPPEKPTLFSNPFMTPTSSTLTPQPPSKPSVPAPSVDIFSIPLVPSQPSPATTTPAAPPTVPEEPSRDKTPPPPAVPSAETPSLLRERRQTLWDLPGSSSPFSRLKEEKMTFTPPPGSPAEPRTPISPTAPPPALGKAPHIALPPTPTLRWFDPSSQSSESDITLSRKRSLLHFPSITLPTPGPSEILSPIHLTTPTPGKGAPSATGGPSPLFQSHVPGADSQPQSASASTSSAATASPPLLAPTPKSATGPKPVLEIQTNGFASSPSSKGKAKATEGDLEMKYRSFVFRTSAVQECWNTWRTRFEHTKEWQGAVSRSKQYKDRLQRSRLGASASASAMTAQLEHSAKKRRISVPTDMATAQARRLKRRKSNQFAQPLTDEALAQRLQENYEENERRWAQGSFRQTVIDRVRKQLQPGTELPEWSMWLSMNTENDKTAIWLEHKFSVPSSGRWISETVFSIPAFKKPQAQDSPGLIVFERTPVEGVDDDIEKKYRVLDDCARLRDIISALPPAEERRYDPCLLVINWSEVEDSEKTRDLVDMTHQLVRDGVIKHVSYFNVSATAKELDKKFADLLDITPLDTEDQQSIALTWKDVRRQFVAPVESAVSDLLDTCWPDDEFDWVRYDRVLSAIGEILNVALRAILGLFHDTPSHVSVEIPEDIQQPGITGRGYATGQFAEALANLLLSSAQELVGSRFASPVVFPVDDVNAAVQKVETAISTQTDRLRQLAADAAFRSSMGPSPKRHASQEDLRFGSSASSKRLRPSPSENGVGDTDVEGNGFSASPPPSTSGATDTSEKPIVTVAMLRALTREMLKTYGK